MHLPFRTGIAVLIHDTQRDGDPKISLEYHVFSIKSLPRPRQDGFTLLELLVVLVILGLLAGYVAPKYFSQIGKSEVKTAQAQIGALEKALDHYRLDVGHYPSTEQGLAALNIQPPEEAKWSGPYLKKTVPNDPWGKPYQYKMPGQHSEVDIFSLGRDGVAGGNGEGADIGNW